MKSPGTTEASYVTFAIMDELIRTLVDKNVFSRTEAISILQRTIDGLDRSKAVNAQAIPVLKEMINEYSK